MKNFPSITSSPRRSFEDVESKREGEREELPIIIKKNDTGRSKLASEMKTFS
jgi:hypothetical protein